MLHGVPWGDPAENQRRCVGGGGELDGHHFRTGVILSSPQTWALTDMRLPLQVHSASLVGHGHAVDLTPPPPGLHPGRPLEVEEGRVLERLRDLALDERTDIYAAGVVLFELLTRRQPFVGSDYQVLSGHVEQAPRRPSEAAPLARIPEAIDAITLRALAKSPDERFGSALEFESALVAAMKDAGIDVNLRPAIAGSGEAQAALAAWTCFDYDSARERADIAARLNRAWSPLKLLMDLTPEE